MTNEELKQIEDLEKKIVWKYDKFGGLSYKDRFYISENDLKSKTPIQWSVEFRKMRINEDHIRLFFKLCGGDL